MRMRLKVAGAIAGVSLLACVGADTGTDTATGSDSGSDADEGPVVASDFLADSYEWNDASGCGTDGVRVDFVVRDATTFASSWSVLGETDPQFVDMDCENDGYDVTCTDPDSEGLFAATYDDYTAQLTGSLTWGRTGHPCEIDLGPSE